MFQSQQHPEVVELVVVLLVIQDPQLTLQLVMEQLTLVVVVAVELEQHQLEDQQL
tara:strand:+ start:459 stop:623 length:165 start_codon:yes stop_codon:yes gene_type:complete